ncbi:sensor domain-containing diguanylate cyclase [Massilia sp. CFBP9026]|uniref:sensor domain-containing diguanylate cyclase n=1 Tax=Massilia sp. CFBP9026 TaxID=3096536 RepID=UPI002A6A5EC5|nr:diguanylate cyclase [Massilia sp. CFBP9026]MDY0962332.1 diguanylate cyclase [Massilia sp. CFBP9026]
MLDTPAETRFDRYTRLAAMTFGVPIALVSLVDAERQWFKSRAGLEAQETPRSISFCSHAVQASEMLVVEDAACDPRFADNPLVTGEPHIRFYAGQPVYSDGQAVGTLCVIDSAPRGFSIEERQVLKDLAGLVETELNHMKAVMARMLAEQALKSLNTELEARIAARTAELEERVAESMRIRQQLEEKQELLDAVLESIDVGVVACDAIGNLTLFNRTARDFHGLDLKAVAPSEWSQYYSLYHADGRTPMAMDEVPLVRALKGEVVRDGAMVIAPSKRVPYTLMSSGRPLRNAQGKTLGAVVAMKDITELKASKDRLVESEERLRTITDNLPVLIAHLDHDHRYVFANAVHQSWLGKAPEQVVGQTMVEAFGEDYWSQQQEALKDAWEGKASQCEHDIVRKKHIRIVHSTFLPHLRDGKVVGVYILTTDATAARMHERNLHALAHTDALTGIPNRRQFELALQAAVQRAPQRERAFALLYLDIDHFKQINDCHGHAVGDMVLVEFARRVRKVVRSSDLVARLAGDEFTVLLDEVGSPRDVELVAKKIMQAMEAPFVVGSHAIPVGVTIGVGLADAPGVTAQAISELADGALYEAKGMGRNTFAIARLADTLALDAVA